MNSNLINEVNIEWLQGFFAAFEWINHKADNGYTFSIEVVAKPGTVRDAIQSRFQGDLTNLSFSQIKDWQAELKLSLRKWLFEFQDPHSASLSDARNSFALSHESSRTDFVTEIVRRLGQAVHPVEVWRFEGQFNLFYECAWDDIVFEEPERIVLLHFGVSD